MNICALCENPVRGHASVTEHGAVFHLCHPDSDTYPDCYRLWTVYGYRHSRRIARWLNDWPSDREWDYRKGRWDDDSVRDVSDAVDDYRAARGVIKWTSDKRPEEIIREMRDAW